MKGTILFLGMLVTTGVYAQYNPHTLFAPSVPVTHSMYRLPSGEPAPNYWQNRADYKIRVTINDKTNRISGWEELTYTNNSPVPLDFLWLQLDQNLFKPGSRGQSRFEAGEHSRYGNATSNFQGGFDIGAVTIGGVPVKYIITDTRMQVWLPVSLKDKGQSVKLKIEYAFTLPEEGADRCGILQTPDGKIFSVAQWYPRMCVFDDLQGWDTDPYLGPGEFYLEYGDFDVEITAPSALLVMAGAEQTNRKETLSASDLEQLDKAEKSNHTIMIRDEDQMKEALKRTGNRTWKFQLKNARDFSWAASSAFLWDAAKINLPSGKKILAMSVYPASVKGNKAWGRSTEFIKESIENYSRRWMEYPYPVAVNVAGNIRGMEYPGIVFCNTQSAGESLFGVTDHEFGHTWFPMIVGSNERKYAWMDEGFNEFINFISAEDVNNGEFKNSTPSFEMLSLISFAPGTESIFNTPQGMKEANIGEAVYYKPAYALTLLRNVIIGEERFDKAFKTYIQRWAYKHPCPNDFFSCIENVTGEDLQWFWKSWFYEDFTLDQSVESVSYNSTLKGNTVVLKNNQQMAMPVLISYTLKSGLKDSLVLPVEIWTNTNEFHAFIPADEPIISLVIDSNRLFPDENRKNNSWQSR